MRWQQLSIFRQGAPFVSYYRHKILIHALHFEIFDKFSMIKEKIYLRRYFETKWHIATLGYCYPLKRFTKIFWEIAELILKQKNNRCRKKIL
jgi:hypothetical protein